MASGAPALSWVSTHTGNSAKQKPLLSVPGEEPPVGAPWDGEEKEHTLSGGVNMLYNCLLNVVKALDGDPGSAEWRATLADCARDIDSSFRSGSRLKVDCLLGVLAQLRAHLTTSEIPSDVAHRLLPFTHSQLPHSTRDDALKPSTNADDTPSPNNKLHAPSAAHRDPHSENQDDEKAGPTPTALSEHPSAPSDHTEDADNDQHEHHQLLQQESPLHMKKRKRLEGHGKASQKHLQTSATQTEHSATHPEGEASTLAKLRERCRLLEAKLEQSQGQQLVAEEQERPEGNRKIRKKTDDRKARERFCSSRLVVRQQCAPAMGWLEPTNVKQNVCIS